MDVDEMQPEQKIEFERKLDLYIETSRTGIENQSDSMNAIDSKVNFLLASLGVIVTLLTDILITNVVALVKLNTFGSVSRVFVLIVLAVYYFSIFINFLLGYWAVKNRDFNFGRDVIRVRDLDTLGLSNLKIKKDIADGLELSYSKNIVTLKEKVITYVNTQRLWIFNMCLTVVILILFLTI